MEQACSVYELKFPNGKLYIGISKNPEKRWASHCAAAFKRARNTLLCRALRKYGPEVVERKILLVGNVQYAQEMEQKIIAAWKTMHPLGYNMMPGGEMSPFLLYPELAKAVGERRKGSKLSEETKNQMSLSAKGVAKTDSHKKAISESRKGMKFSAEHAAKCAENRRGKTMSESAKAAISAFQKENFPMKNEESRKKVSLALRGRTFSEAHKAALRAAWLLRKQRSEA